MIDFKGSCGTRGLITGEEDLPRVVQAVIGKDGASKTDIAFSDFSSVSRSN